MITDDNYYYYCAGEIVNPDDYWRVRSAWITPEGHMIYVTACDHDEVAWEQFKTTVDGAERLGYLHLSFCEFQNEETPRPTDAQVETVLLWCTAHDTPVPNWCGCSERTEYAPMSSRYKIISNRKLRERLYPNSGD